MRLIDADALIEKYQRESGVDLYRYNVIEDLVEAPTVDAVPVWFIRECMNDLQLSADYEVNELGESNGVALHSMGALHRLLAEWEKEKKNER